MPMIAFEKNNPFWQLQQLGQRVNEAVEQLFSSSSNLSPPDWVLPEWLLRSLFWVILFALLGWLGWQFFPLLKHYLHQLIPTRFEVKGGQQNQEGVLPAAPWLRRSHTYARQGNYREACRCLYQAALQHLDDTRLVPQEQSRTNGEYLTLLQTVPDPRPFRVLFQTHEQLCFSNTPISAEDFDHCERAYQEIERAAKKSQQAAR
jgi:hypothetical protein